MAPVTSKHNKNPNFWIAFSYSSHKKSEHLIPIKIETLDTGFNQNRNFITSNVNQTQNSNPSIPILQNIKSIPILQNIQKQKDQNFYDEISPQKRRQRSSHRTAT